VRGCDWAVAIGCLGAGAGLVGFWGLRFAQGKVALGEYVMRLHLAAEYVTAAALIAGGIATLIKPRARLSEVLVGLGLGLVVYASIQSGAFYPEEREIRILLWFTLVFAFAVLGLRLATL